MLFLINTCRKLSVQRSVMSFYAVAQGRRVGIYDSWAQCEKQVKGFKGAKYKKFPTRTEAEAFIKGVSENSTKVKDEHTYWPQTEAGKSEANAISDAELLAAADGVIRSQTEQLSKKRKAESSSSTSKISKHVSTVWEPVGYISFGDYQFQVDIEGYVIAYTDGSCINNGSANPCAGFGVYFGEKHPLNTGQPVRGRVTNNVGEIQAAIHTIKVVKNLGINKLCISTDSQFLINSITKWIHIWKANGWRLKNGTPVKNLVDFKELDELLTDKSIKVKWNYVKGHDGIKGNVMADKLAREGSDLHRRISRSPWRKE